MNSMITSVLYDQIKKFISRPLYQGVEEAEKELDMNIVLGAIKVSCYVA